MGIELLNQTTYAKWAQDLPEEIFIELMRGCRGVHAIGVTCQDQPCGAACWEEQDTAWVLRSIYVLPAYRRQGLGRGLLAYIAKQMSGEGRCLTVSYECEPGRDNLALLPFFKSCGFQMEVMEIPLGITDLETVRMALQERGAYKKMAALRPLGELTTREKHIFNEWLIDKTGEHLSRYLASDAGGCAVMRDGELYGAILYSIYGTRVRLDYCWVNGEYKQLFLPLLAGAADELGRRLTCDPALPADQGDMKEDIKEDIKIEMILSTEQALQVYTRLLDSDMEQTILCMGELGENDYV